MTKTGFKRPTFEEGLAATRANYGGRLPGADPLLARGVLPVLPHVDAVAAQAMHAHLDNNADEGHPLFAVERLDAWGFVWGVSRRGAAAAVGGADFTGTDGVGIPAGTVLRRQDGVAYATDAAVTIAAGVATAAVTAAGAGLGGNAVAGVALTLSSPIAGVTSSAVVGSTGLVGGADIEDTEVYRPRILDRIAEPPHGGADFDYVKWALAQPGVTRAWVYPKELGLGTVVVRFMMDDSYADGIPLGGDVVAVQVALDTLRPVTADLTVVAPVPVPLALQISGLNPATQEVKDAIDAEQKDLIRREAVPGGALLISRIREAISTAAKEYDHVLVDPIADVTHTTGQIAVFAPTIWI